MPLDFMEVGNPFVLGYIEEELEGRISEMINRPYCYTSADVINMLDSYNISYDVLPNYLKEKIDEIELL